MTNVTREMISAATSLLARLPDAGRPDACHSFDASSRTEWSYLPGSRAGIALSELGIPGRKAAHRLLATALSRPAFTHAVTIMALEEVLDLDEHGRLGRHSNGYHVAVFGAPGDDQWAWRFEGHHLSVNVTVTGDQPLIAPLFMGANPAQVRRDGDVVIAPLLREEALARDIIAGLTPRRSAQAKVADTAPGDIITGRNPAVEELLEPPGIPASDLLVPQAEQVNRLLGIYLNRLAPDLATAEHTRIADTDATFAWAGGLGKGEAFYYRIQTPGILIEYQNSQRNDGHAHTVIRRPGLDFGASPHQGQAARL
jgi:hypothetical protein